MKSVRSMEHNDYRFQRIQPSNSRALQNNKGFSFASTLILNAALRNKKGISTNITRSIVLPILSSASMRNAIQCFIVETMLLKHKIKERDRIVKRLEKTKPIAMTPEDQKDFDEATHCYIWLELMGVDCVRDHDHVSGKYRGAAHSECNLQFRLRKNQQGQKDSFYILVFFSTWERITVTSLCNVLDSTSTWILKWFRTLWKSTLHFPWVNSNSSTHINSWEGSILAEICD